MLRKCLNQKLVDQLVSYFAPLKRDIRVNVIPFPHPFFRTNNFQYKFSTTVINKKTKFEFECSDEEQTKLLQILNNELHNSFERLNIPLGQVNKLKAWKTKKGPFNSINDVLDIEGIDIKNLIKICQSIIWDKPVATNRKSSVSRNRPLTSPVLTNDIIQSLTTTVGLHLGPAGISWAHISCPAQKLNYWGTKNFSDLPMKVSSWENFDLAMDVLNDIPPADLYVFEASPGFSLQSQISISNYNQQIELVSMLFALLNTSKKHNKRLSDEKMNVENIVYQVRAKLAARFFKTWVGTERVSTISTVKQLFNYGEFELPCSPICIDQKLISTFGNQPSSNQELMGQSLLLAITFLDLCVLKNPKSLRALTSQYKKT